MKHPYHIVRMHEMVTEGYFIAAQEMHKILRQEEQEAKNFSLKKNKRFIKPTLIGDKHKIELIADILCVCQQETELGT